MTDPSGASRIRPGGRAAQGQLGGDGGAQRAAVEDDTLRRHAGCAAEIVVGRGRVVVETRFGGPALAAAVPAIVEDEDVEAVLDQQTEVVGAMADVAGVAVAPEQPRVGRVGAGDPAVELEAAVRGEGVILDG